MCLYLYFNVVFPVHAVHIKTFECPDCAGAGAERMFVFLFVFVFVFVYAFVFVFSGRSCSSD